MRELSWLAIILGVVIGAVLAAANTFVGLKVGMTISASIPAAVISMLIMRVLLKRGSILENNMVQTIGSAGEGLAAGMIFTLPALFIMGYDPGMLKMMMWGGIGGLLGVCFMVPLRRVLIVKEHGVLPFPEGVACAEVLESGERGGAGAKSVVWGAIVGAVYQLFTGIGCWADTAQYKLDTLKTKASLDSSPALLGVGYILGPRIAAYMLGGAVLGWFILIPAIGHFGEGAASPVFPADALISEMDSDDIWEKYIRYVGAGAVAIGGLISLFKSFPTILSSFMHVVRGVFGRSKRTGDRTDRDLPFPLLVLILGGLGYAMWRYEGINLGHVGTVAVLVFAFFFVTVSSRLVGLVGSSSNPASGMTIASLLATALVYRFFVIGDATDITEAELTTLRVTCISVGAIICIAICIAGDCSQDLKTGFLVKATPWKQQIGEMLGVFSAVAVIAGVLMLLNSTYGFVETPEHPEPLRAPQANIMAILVQGVLGGEIPWILIMMGGAAAVIIEMLGLPALPFAVGLYLPLELSTPIMAGGIIRWLVERRKKQAKEHDPGILTASGLVAGTGIMGVFLAGVAALIAAGFGDPHWFNPLKQPDSAYQKVYYQIDDTGAESPDLETGEPESATDTTEPSSNEPAGGGDGDERSVAATGDAGSDPPAQDAQSESDDGPKRRWVMGETFGEPEEGKDFEKWREQSVLPNHLAPWLWTKMSATGTWVRWRLNEKWWDGLAIFPFAVLTIWLWWCARKRPPVVPPAMEAATGETPAPAMPPSDTGGGGDPKRSDDVVPIGRAGPENADNVAIGIDRNIGSYELSSAIEAEPPPVATDAIEDRAAESIEPPSTPSSAPTSMPPSTQDEETDGVYRFGGVTPDSADEATDEDISFDDIVGISPAGDSESPEAESPKADNATDPASEDDNNGNRNGIGDGDDGSGGTDTDHG
ncbi:MAG: oligopeptide transporter, OPT family, partial [Planctomycetes bacterium]|nr:oligopeptide transporter, OPT family [Planctomycetota bacterium]